MLEKPFDGNNSHLFTNLLIALCGTKKHKFAGKVVRLLEQFSIHKVHPHSRKLPQADMNVLQYLIIEFMEATESLENGDTSTSQRMEYLRLLQLFSKFIGQNYQLYVELNAEAVKAILSVEESIEIDPHSPERREPVL